MIKLSSPVLLQLSLQSSKLLCQRHGDLVCRGWGAFHLPFSARFAGSVVIAVRAKARMHFQPRAVMEA